MELKETVEMMNSADYKERFKAEYLQVVIRYKKLRDMLQKWDNGELNFQPTCPRSTYNMQIKAMTDYIAVLEARAVMEGVDLDPEEIDGTSESETKYKNIYDYIAKNMDNFCGDFTVAVTDVSEMESDMLLAAIYPTNRSGDTADFYLHADGREEYTTLV